MGREKCIPALRVGGGGAQKVLDPRFFPFCSPHPRWEGEEEAAVSEHPSHSARESVRVPSVGYNTQTHSYLSYTGPLGPIGTPGELSAIKDTWMV